MTGDSMNSTANDVMMPNWDTFRYFLAVVRASSISGAAKILSESQPTVGRKIRDLETQLSARLFERGVSGVSLTPSGLRILDNIRRIEQETLALQERVLGHDNKLDGRIGFTAPTGFGTTVLAPHLHEFRDLYPDIDVDLLLGTSKLNILDRVADIAIRVGDPKQTSLVGRKVGAVEFRLYAGANYLRRRDTPQTLADLSGHDVVDSSGDLAHTVQAVAFRLAAPKARRVFCSDDMIAQAGALRGGFGIGALPRYMVGAEQDLVEVLPGHFQCSEDLWVLTHPDLKDIARIRAAFDFALDVAKRAL